MLRPIGGYIVGVDVTPSTAGSFVLPDSAQGHLRVLRVTASNTPEVKVGSFIVHPRYTCIIHDGVVIVPPNDVIVIVDSPIEIAHVRLRRPRMRGPMVQSCYSRLHNSDPEWGGACKNFDGSLQCMYCGCLMRNIHEFMPNAPKNYNPRHQIDLKANWKED